MPNLPLVHILEAVQKRQPIHNVADLSDSAKSDDIAVQGVANLANAKTTDLSFIADKKYLDALKQTQAGVVLVGSKFADAVPEHCIAVIVDSPYLAYASVSPLFEDNAGQALEKQANDIHSTAVIGNQVTLGEGVSIGAYCVLGDNVTIGDNTILQSHITLGNDVSIGANCVIKPQVTIAHDCVVGDGVRIHSQTSIGMEGFGFAPTANPATEGWERIAQLGRVVIGNWVRIGANVCIDRGAIDDTVIEDNVIIDNLVQIAHNVRIGAGTAIAAKTGIAGSTAIGKRCIIGGAVGIAGHLTICDDVTLSGMTMVTKSIKQSGSYSSGVPAMPSAEWRRAAVKFRQSGSR